MYKTQFRGNPDVAVGSTFRPVETVTDDDLMKTITSKRAKALAREIVKVCNRVFLLFIMFFFLCVCSRM